MRPTLLLADDSVTIQRVIELTFAHEDVRVIAVSDGRQAIQRIDLERPDIVLADVSMPHVDGYAVSTYIKQSPSLRHVRVLLLTGAFEPVDDEKVRASGCDGVLVKPFGPQQLVGRVRELLSQEPMEAKTVEVPGAVPADPPVAGQPLYAAEVAAPPPSGGPFELDLDRLDVGLEGLEDGVRPAAAAAAPADVLSGVVGPEPLEPPAEPVWDLTPAPRSSVPATVPPSGLITGPAVSRVSLANAFSALLAAEQQRSSEALTPVVSEVVVEAVVRRVLERLTGDMVRSVVLETAERLLRQEIERLKTDPGTE